MPRCPTETVMASSDAVLVLFHENGKTSVSPSSAELRFTVGYDSALLQRRTFSLRVSCNVHGGLEPRQTVLHKVTSATLMWPTVTLMVGSNASSRLLHERRKNTLRCPTVTLPSLCVYGRWMFSSSSAYLTHAIDGHSASAQIPPFGRSEILCVS